MKTLEQTQSWPAENVSAAVVAADGTVLGTAGDQQKRYPLASVTKLLTAYAFQVALEEEAVALDDPAGPEGSTIRHLLAHSGGYDFGDRTVRYEPGSRRLYSNAGFEVLGEHLEAGNGHRLRGLPVRGSPGTAGHEGHVPGRFPGGRGCLHCR